MNFNCDYVIYVVAKTVYYVFAGEAVVDSLASLAGPKRGRCIKSRGNSAGFEPSAVVKPAPGCRCLPPTCRKHFSKILSVLTRRLRLRRYTRLGAGGGTVSSYLQIVPKYKVLHLKPNGAHGVSPLPRPCWIPPIPGCLYARAWASGVHSAVLYRPPTWTDD